LIVAVKKSVYQGVYTYETREEYKNYVGILRGSSTRFFDDEQAAEALLWANSSEIRPLKDIGTTPEEEPVDPIFSSFLNHTPKEAKKNKQSPGNGNNGNTWKCSKGHINTGSKFCSECGEPRPMQQPKPAPTSDKYVQDRPVHGQKEETDDMSVSININDSKWICSKGHTNDASNIFCMECGERRPAPEAEAKTDPKIETSGTWTCHNGHTNSDKFTFCSECGEKRSETNSEDAEHTNIETVTEPSVWTCSNGHSNSMEFMFCAACGEKRTVDMPAPAAEDEEPVPEQPADQEPTEWTCSHGHTNSTKYAFCFECGEKREPNTSAVLTESVPMDNHTVNEPESPAPSEKSVNEPIKQTAADNTTPLSLRIDMRSLSMVDYKSVIGMKYHGNDGALNDIFGALSAVGMQMARISFNSGNDIIVALRNIYYSDNSIDVYTMSENELLEAVASRKIEVVPASWIYPRQGYVFIDRFVEASINHIQKLASSDLKLNAFVSSNIKCVCGEYAPNLNVNEDKKIIFDPAIIEMLDRVLSI